PVVFQGANNNGSKNFDFYDGNESFETSSNPGAYVSSDMTLSAALRRKRQRRNPVWPYFIVKDGVATCKHCNYSTKSVFSTNLKPTATIFPSLHTQKIFKVNNEYDDGSGNILMRREILMILKENTIIG
ncbi:unnamed protein product, partial [Onchocerca flexuosa]|uniref:BED-type domain-containing protein n=1 Tax=Onchocerca flexuosa TaxID=387005 RepID=A0A183HKI2_9BILA